jgi:hypothetical protein
VTAPPPPGPEAGESGGAVCGSFAGSAAALSDRGGATTSATFGPPVATAPVASTAAAPALSDIDAAPAPPAPAATSATRATVASPEPVIISCSSGVGVIAVAAVRSVCRARWTSWRTAPSVRPSSAATSECARPSTATASSAARWREGSEAIPSSARRISSRRSSSVAGSVAKPPADSGISSSASPTFLSALIAALCAIRYSHGRRSRISVPRRIDDHALRNVAWTTSSASVSDSIRRR